MVSHNIRKESGTSFYFGNSSEEDLHRSVVVLAKRNPNNSYSRDIKFTDALAKHADGIELCPGEALNFKDQKVNLDVFCSGILIGEKTILTANHCMRKLKKHPPTNTWRETNRCPSINILFDYTTKNTDFNKSNIFGCKKIISAEENGLDYAIIELDRKPEGRSPVSIRHSGGPSSETLAMIGSPTGLPLKLAPGKIISADNEHFFMNLDSFGVIQVLQCLVMKMEHLFWKEFSLEVSGILFFHPILPTQVLRSQIKQKACRLWVTANQIQCRV